MILSLQKKNDNSLATKLKDTEYWYLRDKEFKMAIYEI